MFSLLTVLIKGSKGKCFKAKCCHTSVPPQYALIACICTNVFFIKMISGRVVLMEEFSRRAQ